MVGQFARYFRRLVLLLAAFATRSANAQFLGFDLPRPGRSLAAAPPLAESHVPHPAVARVVVDERTSISHGSGVLIAVHDQHALLLTNWHVVRDAAGPINVIFPSGFVSPARVAKVDKDWDLAALGIWNPNAAPIPVSKVPPRLGEPLTIAGYGSGQYRAVTGRCSQYLSPGHRFPYEMIEVSVEARRGDSGGPILNQQGELAGILFGASTGSTSGSHAGRVRRFVAPWIAMVDRPYTAVAAAPAVAPNGPPPVPPTTAEYPGSQPGVPHATSATSGNYLGAPASIAASGTLPSHGSAGTYWPTQATGGGTSPFAAPASSGPLPALQPETNAWPTDRISNSIVPVPIAGDSLNAASRQHAPRGNAVSAAKAQPDLTGQGWTTVPISPLHSPPSAASPNRDAAPPFDHVKNVLAILGVLALAVHLLRRSPPPEPEPPPQK